MHIRLRTLTDDSLLVGLWHQVFGNTWPLNPKLVQRALIDGDRVQPRAVLLAEEQGQRLGFAVVEYEPSAPDHARSGCLICSVLYPRHGAVGLAHSFTPPRLISSAHTV
jgi:hypothetical protein